MVPQGAEDDEDEEDLKEITGSDMLSGEQGKPSESDPN